MMHTCNCAFGWAPRLLIGVFKVEPAVLLGRLHEALRRPNNCQYEFKWDTFHSHAQLSFCTAPGLTSYRP
jgi:hypothetical protein